MLTEETAGPRTKPVTASASLVSDLSWLLHVAARPSMQARYPNLAEMFEGREDLADRVRTFWNDCTEEESCFTEMQVLAQHADAVSVTDPDVLWSALEEAVATVPLDLEMPSEAPEDRRIYLDRLRRLRESPALLRSYLELLEAVWAPVDDMWQQALPVIEEAGRHVVAQYERGRSLELLIPQGCDILRERLPEILAKIEVGQQPLLFVPCLFFGSSMYLEVSGLITIGTRGGTGRRRGPGPDRISGPAPQGGGRSHPSGSPALIGQRAELGGRAGGALPPGPAHREHAREGVAGERVGALRSVRAGSCD